MITWAPSTCAHVRAKHGEHNARARKQERKAGNPAPIGLPTRGIDRTPAGGLFGLFSSLDFLFPFSAFLFERLKKNKTNLKITWSLTPPSPSSRAGWAPRPPSGALLNEIFPREKLMNAGKKELFKKKKMSCLGDFPSTFTPEIKKLI